LKRELRELHRRLATLASLAWALGTIALTLFAIREGTTRAFRGLDVELTSYAAAASGLTWFDEEGRFHSEFLAHDEAIFPQPFDVWVYDPSGAGEVLFRPAEVSRSLAAAEMLSNARATIDEWPMFANGVDKSGAAYRLCGIPAFDDAGEPLVAILVVGDPSVARAEARAFGLRVGTVALLVLVLGLAVANRLVRRALHPSFELLEQRERFLAAAAHELRTPLATMQAITESSKAGDEPAEEALERVSRTLRGATATVEDLLLFARLEAGRAAIRAESVRLDLLVEALLPEEPPSDLELDFQAEETVASVDPGLVEVAVRNLVDNAMRHGAGELRVRVEGNEVSIADRGEGYPAEILMNGPRRFQSRRGTGIGLATVAMIAELHGGKLELSNLRGRRGGALAVLRFGSHDTHAPM